MSGKKAEPLRVPTGYAPDRELVLNRVLKAPRNLVFPAGASGRTAKPSGTLTMTSNRPPTDPASGQEAFTLTRVLNAPREKVWQAHAQAEHLGRWWGPKGMNVLVVRLDFRPGGIFHYCMRSPNGAVEMWGRMIYREIVAPERLVWVNSFSDPDGGLTRAPFEGDWPLEMLNEVTLSESGGRTTLNLRVIALNATAAEQQTFRNGFDSMRGGYGGTFEQLADLVERAGGDQPARP